MRLRTLTLLTELRDRASVSPAALAAWADGRACGCDPRRVGDD